MTAPTRAALSRELIARTALALTDEAGLAGLSMRKLGNELGVEAMSLYHYVENKDDLLDAILDSLYAEIELPVEVPSHDWETAFRQGLKSFYDVLVRHPAALELFASRPAKSLDALTVLLWCYRRFHVVGLDMVQSCHALHFGVAFVMGHVGSEEAMGSLAHVEPDLGDITDPELIDFIAQRAAITSDELWDVGLDGVMAGLRATFDLP